jgi:hypothetical protein
MANIFSNLYTRAPLSSTGAYEWDWQISGYFFFQIYSPPSAVAAAGVADNVGTQLMASCTAITLPDYTIEMAERQGLGGIRVNVPTSLTPATSFEVSYTEIVPGGGQGGVSLPVTTLIGTWVNQIRNFMVGVASTNAASMGQFKGKALFVATDPSLTNVVLAIKFLGIMPTQVPLSGYTADVATNDIVTYSTSFSLDRHLLVDATDSQVGSLLTGARNYVAANATQVPGINIG